MRSKHLFLILTVICTFLLPSFVRAQQEEPQVVNVPDPNLAAQIRVTLGVGTITTHNLLKLTWLSAHGSEIEDLTGLEYAHNLTNLSLWDNNISDISPLAELTNLSELGLQNNDLSDISPLAELTQLYSLTLGNNNISDISLLAELKNLEWLWLHDNNISDISPLTELKNLEWLFLHNNNISDISPLAELKKLIPSLDLHNNNIFDVSPLAELTQLTSLDLQNNNISDMSPLTELKQLRFLNLVANPLSYASIYTHIPAMQAIRIDVSFWERVPETLVKISGDTQQGGVHSALPLPFVVQVRDQFNRRFAGVPVTFTITAGEGVLSATTVETDINGKASVHLRMGAALGATTVRVTAPNISEPIEFTATAIPHTEPVIVQDGNLRARIMETLGKPIGEVLTVTDMLQLRRLTAENMGIYDLTGLGYAANLKSLSLQGNRISNVSPLSGLAQLTSLDLRDNWISDMTPLSSLVHLRDGDGLFIQGNPLSDTSLQTHIPLLQASGVNVHFDGKSVPSSPVVRLIYFLPSDRRPRPDIDAQMDRLIKDVQTFYADEMERHGFGRKTFKFETDTDGNAVVYHITGRDSDVDYHVVSSRIWDPINQQFDASRHIYLIALDVSMERINVGIFGGAACGAVGSGSNKALIPAAGKCFNVTVAAHELGHTFHLSHDFRNNSYLMGWGHQNKFSKCATEWLDVNPYFDSNNRVDHSLFPEKSKIEMLPPSLESQPNGVRLRFKLNDPDGLHQAMLHKNSTSLIACQSLNGSSSQTVDFVTAALSPKTTSVRLSVIDKRGKVTLLQSFPVDMDALLPPEELVSIPDPNLAAAIREQIDDNITTHTLLNLTYLYVQDSEISDLTGLEHAARLNSLNLSGNANTVSDFSPLAGLTNLKYLDLSNSRLTDISSLANLTDLGTLYLDGNDITDISPLANLTDLGTLYLNGNDITDISPLANLTDLTELYLNLSGNGITDISSLANLTNLRVLWLPNQNISDISSLANLTNLTELDLVNNDITDISPLEGLTKLNTLNLSGNNITDISPLLALDPSEPDRLSLGGNPLSDVSINTYLPDLQAKGYRGLPDIQASDVDADLNEDGVVNVQDLVLVSSQLGQTGQTEADVNGDGAVNIQDLVLVAGALGDAAAAPSAFRVTATALPARATVEQWLTDAYRLPRLDARLERGVVWLERLLAALVPAETALLANYPNPFNPETWIPYELAEPAEVMLRIYAVDGTLVRRLVLGHRAAGIYHSKSRAAYWDGRNAQGEKVASGVYFYTFSAGDFEATRKMLIRK